MNDIVVGVVVTVLGFAITGVLGALAAAAVKTIKVVGTLDKQVAAIIDAGAVQAKNTVKLLEANRYVVRALRSHSFAFRELKANGSVTIALGHIDRAEDILNDRMVANAQAAMTPDCREEV